MTKKQDAIDEADEQRAWDAAIKRQAHIERSLYPSEYWELDANERRAYDMGPRRSIAHHLIERNRRIVTETPVVVVDAVGHMITSVILALRGIR